LRLTYSFNERFRFSALKSHSCQDVARQGSRAGAGIWKEDAGWLTPVIPVSWLRSGYHGNEAAAAAAAHLTERELFVVLFN